MIVTCGRGCRHWGRHGAAGLLLHSGERVLLQLRANSHHSGTWSTPGGSLEPGETPWQAAVREAHEELQGVPAIDQPSRQHVTDHEGWAYTTFLTELPTEVPMEPRNDESAAVRWFDLDLVPSLPLHPGFRDAWPSLRTQLAVVPVG